MSSGIYLVQNNGDLVEMREQAYDTEDMLQELLAKYPNLLAGDQIDAGAPRRWLLISREMGVPGEEDGSDRWSLDHLFLDQDAIPTLVEVKRSNDTRIRREVVGQMLDYAANAVRYWPVEGIRARFEESCRQRGADSTAEIAALVGNETGLEDFWQKVKTNLQAGRIRMVFVADLIPPELRRIVEFLNEQMDPAEVLAIEIKQFVGQGMKTLVPRVIGQTAEADKKKGGPARVKKQWDEASFFDELSRHCGEDEIRAARTILDWGKRAATRFWWGQGARDGSFFPLLGLQGEGVFTFGVWTYGKVEVQFQWMKRPPFGEETKRVELKNRLNEIPGVNIPPDAINRRPSIPLAVLAKDEALARFLAIWDWYIEEATKHGLA